jgi:enoyl-CoA hydratase/carnithine racemase
MSSVVEILTERSGSILYVAFNRPARKNAMTMSMYAAFADLLRDEGLRAMLVHGAGDSLTAGNDLGDSLKNPPGPGDSPQQRLIEALINFDKPLLGAVRGPAVGSGTTMLAHFDFVDAARARSSRCRSSSWRWYGNSERAVWFLRSRAMSRRPS